MEKKEKELKPVGVTPAASRITLNMSSTITLTEKNVDDNYDPFAHRESSSQYSPMGALAHILKGSLGSGILSMPMAFMHAGLVFGAIGTVILGIICTHTLIILVNSSQTLCRRMRVPKLEFAETAEAAFQCGPPGARPFASFARKFVNGALFCTYYFGLTTYVVFIAANVREVVEFFTGKPEISEMINERLYIAPLVLLLIPIGLIRKMKNLVPFSMVANLCIVIGFSITIYYLFRDVKNPYDRNWGLTSAKGLPIFFATVLFAMEGIGTVLPVENTMRNPDKLGGWNGVLSKAMVLVVALFMAMGFFGYLEYGELTEGTITVNLPKDEIPAQAVKLLLAVSILFTYPLQFYVPCNILWSTIRHRIRTSYHNMAQNILRIVLVIGTVTVSLIVTKLGPLVSLIGALFFSILGLFIPAVVETVTRWDTGLGRGNWILWKNAVLVLLSLFSAVAGSYVSIVDIIQTYVGP